MLCAKQPVGRIFGKTHVADISELLKLIKRVIDISRIMPLPGELPEQVAAAVIGIRKQTQARDKGISRADFVKKLLALLPVFYFIKAVPGSKKPVFGVNGESVFTVNAYMDFILLSL